MCGIAGIFPFRETPPGDERVVGAMLERLRARGPDDSGLLHENGIVLGHRRLAILDLSSAGHQPMESACARAAVTFNGEIYNHREIAAELGLARDALRSTSDTEILVEGWARRGVELLPELAGQWAFGMLDRPCRRLWLVRDRFGEKPLYYHRDTDRLTFASSIEALLAAPWVRKELDPGALHELVAMRYVVSPRTVLSGIHKVPPGHWMRVDGDGAVTGRWYRMPTRAPGERGPAGSSEELDHLMTQATRRCLVSDVPVALFLSDGIDSHGIAASGPPEISTFSYSSSDSAPAPHPIRNGSHHTVRVSDGERMADLDVAFSSLTEPVGDGVALATWQLVRAARDHATVFLCGHGGDEILGGYRLHRDLLALRTLRRLQGLPAGMLRAFDGSLHGTGTFSERLQRFRSHRGPAPGGARTLINRPLPEADLACIFGEQADLTACLSSVERLYGEIEAECGDLDAIQIVMAQTFLTENLLSFSDAAGMASSAEIRMPYLDRDLVAYVMTRRPSDRVRAFPTRRSTKRLLRRWARGRVPADVIRRKKHGFSSGNITALLERDERGVKGRILDVADLRSALPGIERWLSADRKLFRGSREGTLWAVLALAIWYEALESGPARGREAPPSGVRASAGSC